MSYDLIQCWLRNFSVFDCKLLQDTTKNTPSYFGHTEHEKHLELLFHCMVRDKMRFDEQATKLAITWRIMKFYECAQTIKIEVSDTLPAFKVKT